MAKKIQKITPFLWFDNKAEEAVKFYTSIFKNSKTNEIARYGKSGSKAAGRPEGTVMTVAFEIEGQEFVALNGGPELQFTHAISFVVNCDTQQEIDYYYEKLSQGGETEPCGWVKDKFGVSWQIAPTIMGQLMKEGQEERSERVMAALVKMKKIDIATLKKAYEQEPSMA